MSFEIGTPTILLRHPGFFPDPGDLDTSTSAARVALAGGAGHTRSSTSTTVHRSAAGHVLALDVDQ